MKHSAPASFEFADSLIASFGKNWNTAFSPNHVFINGFAIADFISAVGSVLPTRKAGIIRDGFVILLKDRPGGVAFDTHCVNVTIDTQRTFNASSHVMCRIKHQAVGPQTTHITIEARKIDARKVNLRATHRLRLEEKNG